MSYHYKTKTFFLMTEADIPQLIKRFKENSLSEEEMRFLEAWYVEFASQKKSSFDLSMLEIKVDGLWTPILAQISNNGFNADRVHAPVKRLWPRIVAAASILLIFSLGGYYLFNKQHAQQTAQYQKYDIAPGSNKAILTLANGKKISLTDALTGQVATQTGIKIRKEASGQLVYEVVSSSNKNAEIEYNTVEAPAGGQWQVILADGTQVWLNALSILKYPTSFSGVERKVELTGEGYFEVAHNKSMPFRVLSRGQTVEVLGTHFNLMAYNDEKTAKTTLLEGSVKVFNNGKTELLKPGQQAQVSGDNIIIAEHADLEDAIAWKKGYFKFNESLESIMHKISRWYNVEVVYQDKIDPNLAFGGEISRSKNLSSALKIMELTGNIHFKIDGRRVIVMQ